MALDPTQLPDDIATLKTMLIASAACVDDRDAEIANLKLTIAKMQRDRFGASSERGAKLINQLELQLAELEEAQAQDLAAIDMAAPPADVTERKKPARRPLPSHLPRERVVYDGPEACTHCGGKLLRKLGEDVTETLEYLPATWKVIQHARETLCLCYRSAT